MGVYGVFSIIKVSLAMAQRFANSIDSGQPVQSVQNNTFYSWSFVCMSSDYFTQEFVGEFVRQCILWIFNPFPKNKF